MRGGVTGSSGIGSFVQDLDTVSLLPAYQRKVSLPGSGPVGGAQGEVGGTSQPHQVVVSRVATAPAEQQQQ